MANLQRFPVSKRQFYEAMKNNSIIKLFYDAVTEAFEGKLVQFCAYEPQLCFLVQTNSLETKEYIFMFPVSDGGR